MTQPPSPLWLLAGIALLIIGVGLIVVTGMKKYGQPRKGAPR